MWWIPLKWLNFGLSLWGVYVLHLLEGARAATFWVCAGKVHLSSPHTTSICQTAQTRI